MGWGVSDGCLETGSISADNWVMNGKQESTMWRAAGHSERAGRKTGEEKQAHCIENSRCGRLTVSQDRYGEEIVHSIVDSVFGMFISLYEYLK